MKKILALVLVALLVLAGSAMAEAKAGEGLLIGVVYKQSGNAYFQASVEGIQKAADELGFEFMHDGPDDGSNDGAIRIIENYIAQGVDALVISANDPDALVDVCTQAMEEGIKVVSYDAEVAFPGRDLDVQPSSAKNIGLTLLESIAKSVNYEGQIAVVSAMATAPNQNLWISYIEEELKANEAYKNIEYLGVVYGDDEYQKSFDETQALLNQYPELKGLIVPTTVGGPAVSKCVQDAGRDVKVTGLTLASDMKTFIEAGIADETFLWNPIDLGYVASYAAVALVNGDITGAAGDAVTAGDYNLTVEAKDDAGATILYLNKLNCFNTETVNDWVSIL
ncbi:MAG: substrate-binding domain-containing protein [Clostridia bacterium]|nr:substrate-binding domain-containing protein [Clostridia bacterium]